MAVEALPNILRSSMRVEALPASALRDGLLAALRASWRDFVPSGIVLVCGIAMAIGGFQVVQRHLDDLDRRGFEVEAAGYAGALRDGIRQYGEVLNSIAAFVSASRGVDRWEFLRFAEQTLPRYPGFSALEWVPRVPAAQRAHYEKRAQVDGLFGLRIRELSGEATLVPAGKRAEYYPIYYVEPFAGNERLLGLDLASQEEIAPLLKQAEERGRILATQVPPAGALAGSKANLWFVLPLLDGDAATIPVTQRHGALLGFAIGAIRVGAMVDSVMESLGPTPALAMRLTEQTQTGKVPLYSRSWDGSASDPEIPKDAMVHASSFEVAGQNWSVLLARLPDASTTPQDALPWGVSLICLLMTGLLLQHLSASVVRRRAVERAVRERTAELAHTNADLQMEVAERKRAEVNLRAAKEQAEIASRVKSEFLAMVSHELKTPLNAIIGFSEIISNQTLGPIGKDQYRDYAVDIRDSGHYLLKIINDILDLSRIETGTLTLNEEKVDLAQIMESALRLMRPRADAARLILELVKPEDLAVIADARAMKQIIVNLLSNAVKFTPKGGRITVTIDTEDGRPGFSVADTGIGIPPQDIGRVCEPFVQVDTSLSRRYEGTGLGLALTKRLVEMHGGELAIRSTVGQGTTVAVRLPKERLGEQRPRQ